MRAKCAQEQTCTAAAAAAQSIMLECAAVSINIIELVNKQQ
jgi:hypothetical protein